MRESQHPEITQLFSGRTLMAAAQETRGRLDKAAQALDVSRLSSRTLIRSDLQEGFTQPLESLKCRVMLCKRRDLDVRVHSFAAPAPRSPTVTIPVTRSAVPATRFWAAIVARFPQRPSQPRHKSRPRHCVRRHHQEGLFLGVQPTQSGLKRTSNQSDRVPPDRRYQADLRYVCTVPGDNPTCRAICRIECP